MQNSVVATMKENLKKWKIKKRKKAWEKRRSENDGMTKEREIREIRRKWRRGRRKMVK